MLESFALFFALFLAAVLISVLVVIAMQSPEPSQPSAPVIENVSLDYNGYSTDITVVGNVVSTSSELVKVGFMWSADENFTSGYFQQQSTQEVGQFTIYVPNVHTDGMLYGRIYATNTMGTSYGPTQEFTAGVCLVEGTLVTLKNGETKPIELITQDDELLVWNFDDGHLDSSKPFLIQSGSGMGYNLVTFSNGITLKIFGKHHCFNCDLNKFSYLQLSDTPIGTSVMTQSGKPTKLVSITRVRNQWVKYYSIVTEKHMNSFTNGLLTSYQYNNVYPVVDMKFVKDDREITPWDKFPGVTREFYDGLRLGEQVGISIHELIAHTIKKMLC